MMMVGTDDGEAPSGTDDADERHVTHGPGSERVTDRPRANSILELVEYAYAENGRRLTISRKEIQALRVDATAADDELSATRRLVMEDPDLAVPVSLLLRVAEVEVSAAVRHRLVELMQLALTTHWVFASVLERLIDPTAMPPLTAREIRDLAGRSVLPSGKEPRRGRKAEGHGARVRLGTNAVTAYLLLRVIRDRMSTEDFVSQMADVVWDDPVQRDSMKAAASLTNSRAREALSQLSRHFEARLKRADSDIADARGAAAGHARVAAETRQQMDATQVELDTERERTASLRRRLVELETTLASERSGRVIDTTHLVDDYEVLRTQIVRQLTAQEGLLADGLHALRAGSVDVAEEFVDRALLAISRENARLRDLEGDH